MCAVLILGPWSSGCSVGVVADEHEPASLLDDSPGTGDAEESSLGSAAGTSSGGMGSTNDTATAESAGEAAGDASTQPETDTGAQDDTTTSTEQGDEAASATDGASDSPEESCDDALLNQDESDIDCGGMLCPACANGDSCHVDQDCRSLACVEGICIAAECNLDEDCAHLKLDCQRGQCDRSTRQCIRVDESDGTSCESSNFCIVDSTCQDGNCVGEARDCSQLDGPCQRGQCDLNSARCVAQAANENQACDDLDDCTVEDRCTQGQCRGEFEPILFAEDFDDPDPGWTMTREPSGAASAWEIGQAGPSRFCDLGADPNADRSPGRGGGLAGVSIGDCVPLTVSDDWDCLTSPQLTVGTSSDLGLSFYRYLSTDSGDFARGTGVLNRIQVQYADEPWLTVEEGYAHSVMDTQWTRFSVGFSNFSGPGFRFRVCYSHRTQGFPISYAGWSVDDVEIINRSCSPRPLP